MVPRNAARACLSKQLNNLHLQKQGHTPLRGSRGHENRETLLGVSLTRMMQLHVTFSHITETAGRTRGAHEEAGKSVRTHEANKGRHHAKEGTSGYIYATLAHETHGRVGTQRKKQIRVLADENCSHSSANR